MAGFSQFIFYIENMLMLSVITRNLAGEKVKCYYSSVLIA